MSSKLTVYVVSWSIYPNRILCYLREKGITGQINIVEASMTDKLSAPGKPPGQVPILRIEELDKEPQFITESVAIISYLEAVFPTPNLSGSTSYERAAITSLISAFEIAVPMYFVSILHTSVFCGQTIAGLSQHEPTAKDNLAFAHKYLNVFARNLPTNGPLLTQAQQVTIADIIVAATMQYIFCFYGREMWEANKRLKEFWDAMKDRECMDMEGYVKKQPDFKELARQIDITWDNLTDDEKALAKDTYV